MVETEKRQDRPDRKIAQNLSKKSAVFDPTDGVESADWARKSGFQGFFMTNLVDFALILLKFRAIIFNLIYNCKKYAYS